MKLASAFFSRSARTSDTGKIYLIRIYMTLLVAFTVLLVASLHTVRHYCPLSRPLPYTHHHHLPYPLTSPDTWSMSVTLRSIPSSSPLSFV